LFELAFSLTLRDLDTEDIYHLDQDTTKVSYWYKPGQRSLRPIVFVHGIGCAFTPYIRFIFKLSLSKAPIFLIELPHVSMKMASRAPSIPDTVREIQMALSERGFKQAVWVGHSLGSTIVAGACRYISKSVSSVVLLDPVCFLLHHPDVVFNFVHRKPNCVSSWIIRFFAGLELFISRFIGRQFHWYHSYLWANAVPANTKVYLSVNDVLVPSARVAKYLNEHNVENEMMPLHHAQLLMRSSWETKIVAQIILYCKS